MSINLTSRKSELNSQELSILQIELEKRSKNKVVTYLLWWFLGILGVHRFYLGDTGLGIAQLLLSWATCGIWWIIDVFLIGKRLDVLNAEVESRLIDEIIANRRTQAQY